MTNIHCRVCVYRNKGLRKNLKLLRVVAAVHAMQQDRIHTRAMNRPVKLRIQSVFVSLSLCTFMKASASDIHQQTAKDNNVAGM